MKVNFRCIKGLNVKCRTLRHLRRNTEVYLYDFGGGEWFLKWFLKQETKSTTYGKKIDEFDIKSKNSAQWMIRENNISRYL